MESLIPVSAVRRVVAGFYYVTEAEMIGVNRSQRIARPRQVAMTLAREYCKRVCLKNPDQPHKPVSLPRIGKLFGGRDHTTVLHAMRRVSERERDDPIFRQHMKFFRGVLTGWQEYVSESETLRTILSGWHISPPGGWDKAQFFIEPKERTAVIGEPKVRARVVVSVA